jgi:hypothetical protein
MYANVVLGLLLSSVSLFGNEAPGDAAVSYVTTARRDLGGALQIETEVYTPQPGDLVLYDEHSKFWQMVYLLVGTRPPDHAGIIVRAPNGELAILEAAPDDGQLIGLRVGLLQLMPRLQKFDGHVCIRRLKKPLDEERCHKLTDFAVAQCGKRYALGRFLLQATPFRARCGLRAKLFGKTDLDRHAWMCSELVVAAGTVVGLFDPTKHKANMIYPSDLLFDDRYDLRATWEVGAAWSASLSVPSSESRTFTDGTTSSPIAPR